MGRFEQRRERNKKLIADVDNFIFDNQKIWNEACEKGLPTFDKDFKDGYIKGVACRFNAMLQNRGWCWVDLVTVLNLIRKKMIDLGKLQEFEELYNEYKPEDEKATGYNYGNWDFLCIFIFASHLIIDFPEVIHKIADGLIKDSENG